MNAQFIIAVMSSLTTALILALVRQFYKARKYMQQIANEHRFLMFSMSLVLKRLDLEKVADDYRGRPWRS